MAGECVPEGPDLKEMGEEELWELINDNRHRISLGVRPCILIPYLRQARVLTELDEDEILSCHSLKNRSMRTSKNFSIGLSLLILNRMFTYFTVLSCAIIRSYARVIQFCST